MKKRVRWIRWQDMFAYVFAVITLIGCGPLGNEHQSSVTIAPIVNVDPTNTPVPTVTLNPPQMTMTALPPSLLQLNLNVSKSSYVLGEPISLTFTLSNATVITQALSANLDPMYGDIQLLVSSQNQTPDTYMGPNWDMLDVFDTRIRSFPPNQSISFARHILFDNPESPNEFLVFSTPGIYTLQASIWQFPNYQDIQSAPITVEILAPTGTDATVWSLLQNKEAIYALDVAKVKQPSATADLFQQILTDYPTSTYTPYIQAAISSTQ